MRKHKASHGKSRHKQKRKSLRKKSTLEINERRCKEK